MTNLSLQDAATQLTQDWVLPELKYIFYDTEVVAAQTAYALHTVTGGAYVTFKVDSPDIGARWMVDAL